MKINLRQGQGKAYPYDFGVSGIPETMTKGMARMEDLIMRPTENSFGIDFNTGTGILKIEGTSYPENPKYFFKFLDEWLDNYIAEIRGAITLNLKIGYLNSSSIKCLLDFIQMLEDYCAEGGNVKINWYYETGDENIMEIGKELAVDMILPMKLIELPRR